MIAINQRRFFDSTVQRLLKETTALYLQLSSEERAAPLRPAWADYRQEIYRKWRAAGASRRDAKKLAINEAYAFQHMSEGRDAHFREGLRMIEAALTLDPSEMRIVPIH